MSDEQRAAVSRVVTIDSAILHGTACFTGTRVPVQTLIDYLESDETLEQFLADFSRVTRDQAVQFLELSRDQLLACVSC